MGSDKARDTHALDDDVWPAVAAAVGAAGGQGTVDLPAFYVARYPVTVAQFRVFIEATGLRLGLDEGLKHEPEQPFVVVSWHEALKYCEWLEERFRLSDDTPDVLRRRLADGGHVGLASEAQWEKAARGIDGNVYPWGDTIDPSRANYVDTGLGKTSLVGAFPAGASPYRGLDMSGNVWEWTLSLEPKCIGDSRHIELLLGLNLCRFREDRAQVNEGLEYRQRFDVGDRGNHEAHGSRREIREESHAAVGG